MQSLLKVHQHWPDPQWLDACHRIAARLEDVFVTQGRDITRYGNHSGLSSLIAIHPLAELSLATQDASYAGLAEHLVGQGERRAELRPLEKLLGGQDVASIGTGKAYQILWLLLGLAKLHEATNKPEYLAAVQAGWSSVREHHLTPGGGPWGGIGRHKEVFNEPGFFNPYGLVETCSAMAWMQLNRALFHLRGEAVYAQEFEKTLYNTLLGAMDLNGEDWCYFTFPNGRRNLTYSWACCKSSGAIALEEAPLLNGSARRWGLYAPGAVQAEGVRIEIETHYPFEPDVLFRLEAVGVQEIGDIAFRVPDWAAGASIQVDGETGPRAIPGHFAVVDLRGKRRATILLSWPMTPQVRVAVDTLDHHGQEIVHRDYFAVVQGPLVYATGLIDGYRTEETLRAPKLDLEKRLESVPGAEGASGPTLRLRLPGREPIDFRPYFEAGGRSAGTWRSTWMGVAWQ